MGISKTNDHIQINIKMLNPIQESPASSKAPNQDLKDVDVLCIYKIKIVRNISEHGCNKDQGPYPNQDQDAKPKSGASSVLQNLKSWLRGQPKFGIWVYQRPVPISQSRSRCETDQEPLKPQIKT